MGAGVRLSIGTDPGEVARARAGFTAYAEAHRLPATVRRALSVALDELLHNTITHGFAGKPGGAITIDFERGPTWVRVTLTDDGRAFNPLEAAAPDTSRPVEQRPVGGLGIHLVRELMDEVRYDRRDDRNVVTLVKRLTA